ncbi:MAG: DNA ligase [Candidatus Moanabacter tarae]|uniref:DNA ligase n=1 Tax=Candidatus Moanibacter tarae TaxID=2200854 RepID=A0A2Z4ABN9_9BACT|nr:MAG: DNA ligase [Candidatus Moanabacter tarae]|tara:strand:- start:2905 stop:5130 length:2226 start_codon:yes stop_codon:yes gene_type:complete
MLDGNTASRIVFLRSKIKRYDEIYFRAAQQGTQPEISDQDYDNLKSELAELEERNPKLKTDDSPTQNVGDDRLEGFKTYIHRQPMLSLDNTYNKEELFDFERRLQRILGPKKLIYVIEPKIDGVAVSLTYEKGSLKRAVTRGNGAEGDDITASVSHIEDLPRTLIGPKAPEIIEIRGEIYMTLEEFKRINRERAARGKPLFTNPRNFAAGSVKLLDQNVARERKLEIVLYAMGSCEPQMFETQVSFQEALRSWAMPVVEQYWLAHGIEQAWVSIKELDQRRHKFRYATDGAVIKLNDTERQSLAGSTAKAPRWAIAYKFAAEQAATRLRAITVQVGRTGRLTPVAELDPLDLAGTTVSRASLHNAEEISRKDIRVGDTVVVEKAGEIIPAIIQVITENRPEDSQPFDLLEHLNGVCPSCGEPIHRLEGFVDYSCVNFQCTAQVTSRIEFFASRRALNIESLGGIVAEKIVENFHINSPVDLFDLEEVQLSKLNLGTENSPHQFGPKNAAKIVEALHRSRNLPLSRWLYGFGIPYVGEAKAKEISKLHKNLKSTAKSKVLHTIVALSRLKEERNAISPNSRKTPPKSEPEREERKIRFHNLGKEILELEQSLDELPPASEIGPVSAQNTIRFFESGFGTELIHRLMVHGINPHSDNYLKLDSDNSRLLEGKTFVLTGTLPSFTRDETKAIIEQAGGKILSSVTKATDYLVAGESPGSKLGKATMLNIKILNESGLLSLLNKL